MGKIIIGIHGLKNKVSEDLLRQWWVQSIIDGFQLQEYRLPKFSLAFAYWADLMYDLPLNVSCDDPQDDHFVSCPYEPPALCDVGFGEEIRKKIREHIDRGMDTIFMRKNIPLGFESIESLIMNHEFHELSIYYNKRSQSQSMQRNIRNRLADILEQHKHDHILLIGHSMGSIIAYDTLRFLTPHIFIDDFITLGSPLGIPVILREILKESQMPITEKSQVPTPRNIRHHWYNFVDVNDPVTLDLTLKDDFSPNQYGVHPQDFFVHNDYKHDEKANHHKVYGYLRTKECAEAIYEFLTHSPIVWQKVFRKKV